jgi:hypothetical protein
MGMRPWRLSANQPRPCPSASKLMRQLKVKVEAMLKDVEPAQLDHPLAAFSGNSANCALGSFEDDWEARRMKQAFGWGEDMVGWDFAQRQDRAGWVSKICGVLSGPSWFAGGLDQDERYSSPGGR